MRRIRAPFLAATAALLACGVAAGPAIAAPSRPQAPKPGQWARITANGLENFTDVGIARGSDGILHVLWTSQQQGNQSVFDVPITSSGIVRPTVTLATHLFIATFPGATATPHGLDAFWNEDSTGKPGTTIGTVRATRPLRGGSWHKSVASFPSSSFDFGVGAATGSDGQPWVVFINGGNGSMQVTHYGHAKQLLHFKSCCVFNSDIGVDGKTGTTWLTYFALINNNNGYFAQKISQTGSRIGPATRLPRSDAAGITQQPTTRVLAVSRGHGRPGVYVTYLTGVQGTVLLDKLGSSKPLTITRTGGTIGSTEAADPRGRIWVGWYGSHSFVPFLFVRRSNNAATGFGRSERVRLPAGTQEVWKAYLSAQPGRLDVLALLTVHGKIAYWHTQVLASK